MSVIADPAAVPPRVGFAVGRSAGSAPARNRIRRRLRVLARAHAESLKPGWYLVGAEGSFAELPFRDAEQTFLAALAEVGAMQPGTTS